MSSWGNSNTNMSMPKWATTNDGINLRPTQDNANLLFANTTANAFVTGETIGVFGVDQFQADASGGQVHTGWVMQTTGQGGRAGRVQNEVLVATSSMSGGVASAQFPNTVISITSQPVANSAVHGSGNTVTFQVAASSSNPNVTLGYDWFFNPGTGFVDAASNGTFTGATSNTLVANATTTIANTWSVKCVVTCASAFAANVNSASALVTVN